MSKVVIPVELPLRPGSRDEFVAALGQPFPLVEPVAGRGPEL